MKFGFTFKTIFEPDERDSFKFSPAPDSVSLSQSFYIPNTAPSGYYFDIFDRADDLKNIHNAIMIL